MIAVAGELDLATGPELEQQAAAVMAAARPVLVLDLGAVTFLDVAGLRALLGLDARARARGGSLRLVNPGPAVLRLLDLTGTRERFALYGDVPAALAAAPDETPPTSRPAAPEAG